MVLKVDQYGHVHSFGNIRARDPRTAIALAQSYETNRDLTAAVTGRLSSSGGTPRLKKILATTAFTDEVTTTPSGPTIATLNASLDLVTDALAGMFVDANLLAVALGIDTVTNGGGGTPASPIDAITGAGTAADVQNLAAEANPARIAIDTNMHTLAALTNKILRATGWEPLDIESNPELQPPPDDYGAGGTGVGGATSTAGSGRAFGTDSPFTNPTPLIDDSMTDGGVGSVGVTKAAWDAALDIWRDNVETIATRLALVTNTVVALTDSSTGTASGSLDEMTAFVNAAASGSDLADKTTTEAEMTDIKNAIASMGGKLNALAAGIGAEQRTYDGGGTVTSTLAAIGTVTGAATGVQATEMNTWRGIVHTALDALAEHVNEVAKRVDVSPITRVTQTSTFPFDNPVNPQQKNSDFNATTRAQSRYLTDALDPFPGSTVPVTGGTAADPGVKKAAADTALALVADNIATIAAKINSIRTAVHGPLVKVV